MVRNKETFQQWSTKSPKNATRLTEERRHVGGTVRNSEEHIDSSDKVGRKGMKQTIINRKSLSLLFSARRSGKRHANLRTGESDKDLQNEGSTIGNEEGTKM